MHVRRLPPDGGLMTDAIESGGPRARRAEPASPERPVGTARRPGAEGESRPAARLSGDLCHAYVRMVLKMTRRQLVALPADPRWLFQLDLSGKPGIAFVLAPVGLIANHLPLTPWPLRSPGFASAMKK